MNILSNIINNILSGKQISRKDAENLISPDMDIWALLNGANQIRQHFKGNQIGLCSIINAKSGDCAEDCRFCAQSAHHKSQVNTYPLVSEDEIYKGFQRAKKIGANGYSIVTSGNELSDNEIDTLCEVIHKLNSQFAINNSQSVYLCASLGRLTKKRAGQLKSAGLTKAHHNIETSRRFFEQVCTTHTYDERLDTVRTLKDAGLRVCSGGIFGMGENWQDRLDMAFTLRELDVDSVPLNFLIPIKGTAMENITPLSASRNSGQAGLTPLEILKTIALFRYILPNKNIRICAGREKNLRDLQSWIFYAGADGMMIGGYLTQPGRNVEDDLQMIKDLELVPTIGNILAE